MSAAASLPRTTVAIVCAAMGVVLPLSAQSSGVASQGAKYSLSELEERAVAADPAIAAAEADVKAEQGAASQAGRLANPVIGYLGEDIRTGPPTEGGQHGVFVEQLIPLGGKLHVRRDALLLSASAAEARLDGARAVARRRARSAYAGVLVSDERARLARGWADLLSESVLIARQRYNVGTADRPDLLDAEAEASTAALELRDADADRETAWRRLASAVGDPALARRPLAATLDDVPSPGARMAAWEAVLRSNPDVVEATRRAAAAESLTTIARHEATPDLRIRGGAVYDRALDDASSARIGWEGRVEIGVTVPLWNKNTGAIAGAEAAQLSARARVAVATRSLARRFDDTYTAFSKATDAVRTYRDEILPRAQQAADLYLARYREMAGGYPEVLLARRALGEARARYVAALAQAWQLAIDMQSGLVESGAEPGVPAR